MAEDTRWQEREPTTDAELYDMLRWAFGLGTYDALAADDDPYWKARGVEIGKVKRTRTRYQVSVADVALAARYCQRHRIPVRYLNQIIRNITEAKAEQKLTQRATSGLEYELAEAILRERSLARPESEHWVMRLTRAQGQYREEVLAEWQQSLTPSATTTA